MKMQRFALAAAGIGLLAATVASVPAAAAGQADPSAYSKTAKARSSATPHTKAAAAACDTWVGYNTPTPGINSTVVTAPRTVDELGEFGFVGVRTSASWYAAQNASGSQLYLYGLFLQGGNLYRTVTYLNGGSIRPTYTKVGSGWTSFKTIATSNYSVAKPVHSYLYGLNSNGSLYRYSQTGGVFRALGSFPGFKSFKAMTVVSETATYDTLLMTTTAGALWTVRIPTAASTKPALKLVRSAGFGAYESLVAYGCGTRGGSLVTGVDLDTDSGTQYAMSKFTGSTTAITNYGKIATVFPGTTAFSIADHYDQLVGE
jgi:hypothetical protein